PRDDGYEPGAGHWTLGSRPGRGAAAGHTDRSALPGASLAALAQPSTGEAGARTVSLEVLSPARTAALLPYGPLAEEIAVVMREVASGQASVPPRTIVELALGTLLTMPAADQRLAVVKVVTVHPGNAARGEPTISGEVIVAAADDGRRLGVLHGGSVTVRRTAALSLLAARTLWTPGAEGPLLVVGAGAQGRGHAEALATEPGVTRVLIASRTRSKAEALARDLADLDVE